MGTCMASIRQQKVSRLIQREMSEILAREIDDFRGIMITLSHVSITADLGIARCYITTLPEDRLKGVLHLLNEENAIVRRALARRTGGQLRVVPNIEFYEDDTMRVANRLEELFADIKPTAEIKNEE
jgi:ribosome-binding factor A